MMKIKVYCIIVTYNGAKWIENCLKSIEENKIDLKIIVIDNNSKDNTCDIIQRKFPNVHLIKSDENLGFGGANNLGAEIAVKNNSKYIYLLNQDTISSANNIYNLIKIGELEKEIGVVSPIHLNDNGSALDFSFEDSISSNSCPNLISDLILKRTKLFYEIEEVCAASWLVKVEVIKKIGLFSDIFFHYGEDTNFVQRLKYFKYKLVIVPSVFISHCREERKNVMYTKEHIKRRYNIIMLSKILNINKNFLGSYKDCVILSLSALSKNEVKSFFKIILLPILRIKVFKKMRSSYKNVKL